jgi:4-amino-4-deoxy-L-arabinose transferase-like glycosyltransferase
MRIHELKKLLNKKKTLYTLFGFFLTAVFIRFLFFPSNTQFAYDHAREAFNARQILSGDFKIIGPPTTANPLINHGALFYYIAAPVYWLSGGNPEGLSIFLRLYNAAGVFLIFALGTIIANKRTGLMAALLYAISFEQTQYSLFMGHPAMAVLTTMTMYFGFALLIFRKKTWGLILAAVGFGLSIQFHFGLVALAPLFVLYPLVFRKQLPKVSVKTILVALTGFALTTITFILADLKYNFRTLHGLLLLLQPPKSDTGNIFSKLEILHAVLQRYITDNFFIVPFVGFSIIVLGVVFFLLIKRKPTRSQGIFLLIWLIWGMILYYLANSQIYYYSVGTSISLLLLAAFLLDTILIKKRIIGITVITLIVIWNFYQIMLYNPQGPINAITSQDGMLLKDEKAIIDYTYKKADGKPFAINALTIPYEINTTWSYLYDWYGKKKYGYVPVWGGSHASGFYTALQVNTARSTLPDKRFLIIEQTPGLLGSLREDFFKEENQYTYIISTSSAGLLTVYEQKPKK